MAYIKDGQVVDRPPWRLGAILDYFWAIVNGIAFFFSTMFGDDSAKGPAGRGSKGWRGGDGRGRGGGWGGGRRPPPGGGGGSGSRPIAGLDRVRGIDHCATAAGGA